MEQKISTPERLDPRGPILLLIRGLPGSGKSTQARFLSEKLGKEKSLLLDPDYIDKKESEYLEFSESLAQKEPDLPVNIHPYRYLMNRALNGLKFSNIVIWNQPFIDLDQMDYTVRKLAKDSNIDFETIVVDIETPIEISKQRNRLRIEKGGHGPSEEVFDGFVANYKRADSLGYRWIALDGTQEPEVLCKEIFELLLQVN